MRHEDWTRLLIQERWEKLGLSALLACCGGVGLVVGCPICGRRFA